MRAPSTPDDDFLFDVKETASILGRSTRVAYLWGNSGKITSKLIPVSGTAPQVFFSIESILAFAEEMGLRPKMNIVEALTQDTSIIRRFESLTAEEKEDVQRTFEEHQTRSERAPSPQGVEIVSELRERLAEKDERIADLQSRLDETQGKYETILVESGEKQQALILQRVGVEKALTGIIYKAQKAEPQLRFIEQKDERGVIVDVEVVKDSVKPFPWAYVWGAVSTIAILGLGTYLALTYSVFG